MDRTADIICHFHALADGSDYVTYHWIGKSTGVVRVDHDLSAEIDKLPWKLKLVKTDQMKKADYYIRADSWFGMLPVITMAKEKINTWFTWIKSRAIATARIWGIIKTNREWMV